jgi:hypothetical protein
VDCIKIPSSHLSRQTLQGKVYTATQHGLYLLKAGEDVAQPAHFVRFGDLIDRFFGLTVTGSTVYAISEDGAYSLDPATAGFNRIGSGGGRSFPLGLIRDGFFSLP